MLKKIKINIDKGFKEQLSEGKNRNLKYSFT